MYRKTSRHFPVVGIEPMSYDQQTQRAGALPLRHSNN